MKICTYASIWETLTYISVHMYIICTYIMYVCTFGYDALLKNLLM